MNFTITLFLVLFAVIVTMGAVIYVLFKQNRANKKQIADGQARLESARANIEELLNYFKGLEKITKDEKEIAKRIKEAESDEEVYNIIADIVGTNNQRVQNNESN